MFRSLNFTTIITTTITITASIVAIAIMTTRRSWWCRDIGGIITTIITTIIIASIIAAATIEVADTVNEMNRTFGSCLLLVAGNWEI